MKNLRLLLFVFLIFFSVNVFSQQVYICENVTSDGEPENAKPEWVLEDGEVEAEILFDNGNNLINLNFLYLFIDKKYDGSFEPFDSKTIKIENEASWVSYRYTFKDDGEYDVYFMDLARASAERK